MSAPSTQVSVTAAKAVVAAIGGILAVLVPILQNISGFLPPPWSAIVTGIIAILTVTGVYAVPNKQKVG